MHFQPEPETDGQAAAQNLGGREEDGERQELEPDQQQQDEPRDQLGLRQPGVRDGEDGQGNQEAELPSPGLPLKSESRMLRCLSERQKARFMKIKEPFLSSLVIRYLSRKGTNFNVNFLDPCESGF